MDADSVNEEELPTCDVCGLPLELKAIDVDGHPAVSLSCLVHGQRQTWEPFANN